MAGLAAKADHASAVIIFAVFRPTKKSFCRKITDKAPLPGAGTKPDCFSLH
jgi:hypothetical protein